MNKHTLPNRLWLHIPIVASFFLQAPPSADTYLCPVASPRRTPGRGALARTPLRKQSPSGKISQPLWNAQQIISQSISQVDGILLCPPMRPLVWKNCDYLCPTCTWLTAHCGTPPGWVNTEGGYTNNGNTKGGRVMIRTYFKWNRTVDCKYNTARSLERNDVSN